MASVFRTTKNNHNILQGVADPSLRLTQEAKDQFDAWILKNGLRWTAEGGPLAPGGVDIAFIGTFNLSSLPQLLLIELQMTRKCPGSSPSSRRLARTCPSSTAPTSRSEATLSTTRARPKKRSGIICGTTSNTQICSSVGEDIIFTAAYSNFVQATLSINSSPVMSRWRNSLSWAPLRICKCYLFRICTYL